MGSRTAGLCPACRSGLTPEQRQAELARNPKAGFTYDRAKHADLHLNYGIGRVHDAGRRYAPEPPGPLLPSWPSLDGDLVRHAYSAGQMVDYARSHTEGPGYSEPTTESKRALMDAAIEETRSVVGDLTAARNTLLRQHREASDRELWATVDAVNARLAPINRRLRDAQLAERHFELARDDLRALASQEARSGAPLPYL